jgi:REP element-mobilizing transposase RayT
VVDLTDPRLAPIVIHALRYRDGDWHWLYDYTVMPDHAHAILKPIVQDDGATSLSDILQGVKSWSAHEMNRVLRRKGPLWQDETHNRILRDEAEYREKANYILQNAHDWGLVDDPTEWPWWGKGNGPW